jgi:AraC-like DNA-binding protein
MGPSMHWATESPFAHQLQDFVGRCQVLSALVTFRQQSLRDVAEALASALPRPRCSADFVLLRSLVVDFATHAVEASAADRADALKPLLRLNGPDEPLGQTLVQCLTAIEDAQDTADHPSVHALRARRAMAAITSRCAEPNIDAAAIARDIRVSPRTLRLLLQTHFGVGFRTALRRARVSAALTLLERSIFSVKEIADRVGYTSTSQFDRDFKRHCGITPGQYRGAQCCFSSPITR